MPRKPGALEYPGVVVVLDHVALHHSDRGVRRNRLPESSSDRHALGVDGLHQPADGRGCAVFIEVEITARTLDQRGVACDGGMDHGFPFCSVVANTLPAARMPG